MKITSIKTKFLFYFATIFATVAITGVFLILNTQTVEKYLKNNVPEGINIVRNASKLNTTAQLIRYDDEVLTQSARNYAFTKDVKWKNRYNEFAPKLDQRINEAIIEQNSENQSIFNQINNANLALIELEAQAITNADNNKLTEAQTILESQEYWNQKNILTNSINEYLAQQGTVADEATVVSTKVLDESQNKLQQISKIQKFSIMGFIVLFLLMLISLYAVFVRTLLLPLSFFQKASGEITQGRLETRVNIDSKDEVGEFAANFNKMTKTLKDSIENTEKKVKERTEDLEKLNRFMTGREIKMIELKEKIEKLEKKNENQK